MEGNISKSYIFYLKLNLNKLLDISNRNLDFLEKSKDVQLNCKMISDTLAIMKLYTEILQKTGVLDEVKRKKEKIKNKFPPVIVNTIYK